MGGVVYEMIKREYETNTLDCGWTYKDNKITREDGTILSPSQLGLPLKWLKTGGQTILNNVVVEKAKDHVLFVEKGSAWVVPKNNEYIDIEEFVTPITGKLYGSGWYNNCKTESGHIFEFGTNEKVNVKTFGGHISLWMRYVPFGTLEYGWIWDDAIFILKSDKKPTKQKLEGYCKSAYQSSFVDGIKVVTEHYAAMQVVLDKPAYNIERQLTKGEYIRSWKGK
jgi:hypothetical protein